MLNGLKIINGNIYDEKRKERKMKEQKEEEEVEEKATQKQGKLHCSQRLVVLSPLFVLHLIVCVCVCVCL